MTGAAAKARQARVGLALAALIAGVTAAPFGLAPFTGIWAEVGGFAISSVLLFDIGVYLAVVGGILTLIFALEETH